MFYLSKGKNSKALKVYDTHVWGIDKDYSQDQIGATSLLARIEFAGVNIGKRWKDIAKYISKRSDDTTNPFNTMQYLFALAKASHDGAQKLFYKIQLKASDQTSHNFSTWSEVVLPACEGSLTMSIVNMTNV